MGLGCTSLFGMNPSFILHTKLSHCYTVTSDFNEEFETRKGSETPDEKHCELLTMWPLLLLIIHQAHWFLYLNLMSRSSFPAPFTSDLNLTAEEDKSSMKGPLKDSLPCLLLFKFPYSEKVTVS